MAYDALTPSEQAHKQYLQNLMSIKLYGLSIQTLLYLGMNTNISKVTAMSYSTLKRRLLENDDIDD